MEKEEIWLFLKFFQMRTSSWFLVTATYFKRPETKWTRVK